MWCSQVSWHWWHLLYFVNLIGQKCLVSLCVLKTEPSPWRVLSFVFGYRQLILGPWKALPDESVFFCCLGALATKQSNDVIYDEVVESCLPIPVPWRDERLKAVVWPPGGNEDWGSGADHMWSCPSKNSECQRFRWTSLVGNILCVTHHDQEAMSPTTPGREVNEKPHIWSPHRLCPTCLFFLLILVCFLSL